MGGEGFMWYAIEKLQSNREYLRKHFLNSKKKKFLNTERTDIPFVDDDELFADLEPMDKTDVHSNRFDLEYFIVSVMIVVLVVIGLLLL